MPTVFRMFAFAADEIPDPKPARKKATVSLAALAEEAAKDGMDESSEFKGGMPYTPSLALTPAHNRPPNAIHETGNVPIW